MKFDLTYQGKVFSMVGGTLYDYDDGYFTGVGVSADFDGTNYANGYQVATTGYYETSVRGNKGYQTNTGKFILLNEGWQQVGVVAINQYSQSQAQALVNKIIECNKKILRGNLLCARYANKLTSAQQQSVRDLQSRLQARNNALQAEGLLDIKQTGTAVEYAELSPYLDRLMAGESIGVATWVVIVLIATVLAGLGTAVYFAYKHYADEAEQDVKYSEDLTRILTSKLTEEEYQQLLDETKGMLTKEKIRNAFGNAWSNLKWAAAIAAGILGVYWYKKNKRLK